jgi:2-phosphoglycerate kinase
VASIGVVEDRIDVVGKDGRWPFNQGRLLQSLYPTGLEADQALEVVVAIEWTLRQGRAHEVTRDRLRALVHEMLERDYGAEYARRYRVWRAFQNQDVKPLILLLGGTSGVGKSSLAIEVARRLSIARVLSTDAIRDVMRVMISDDLVPTLHVSSFEAHQRLVTAVAPGLDPIVEGFLDQSRTVAVGVRAVIERAIIEGTNTVIDGVSLVPGLYDLAGWRDRAHVVLLLAADEDLESLRAHIVARAHGRGARASERYLRSFEEIVRIQEALLERARTFGVEVIDVRDLEAAVRHVVSHVVGGLAATHEAQAAGLD